MTPNENNGLSTFEGTQKRAREGNALSQNLLGIWILNSQLPDGVEVNEDPFELIRLSAEQGFPTAQYNMGIILETGYLWINKDEKQALEWYRKAANQGCAEAKTAVGICLYKGVGIEPKLSDALSWLKEAAAQGDQRGQLFLAEILAKDERCCDKDEALYWFCQLAQHESLRYPELRGYAF
jgi:TPR repeat protein